MSDDLVKRLREYGDDPQDVSLGEWAEWSHKWADRIEELEAVVGRQHKRAETLAEGWRIADDARIELEAKLAKVVEALGRIASNEFAGRMLTSMPPQGAAEHFARATLAELTGGKDG